MLKIVVASTLKPIDDVRAFWKISQSIAKTNKYEVNIIGNEGKKEQISENIFFHQHFLKRNQLLKRLLIPFKILFQTLQLKPQLLIITTHELLLIAFISKLLLRCKIIYDVQENYYLNMMHIRTHFIVKLYAIIVRFKELLSQFYIDIYWLAERCYLDELSFVKSKYQVVENKAFKIALIPKIWDHPRLVFTGTISNYSGVENALKVFDHIKQKYPSTTLKIIGQVHNKSLANELIKTAKKDERIELEISSNSIPHPKIVKAILTSNLGVIGYLPSKVNRNKIPTKLYEYSRYQLPYLVAHQSCWNDLGTKLGGAIPVYFSSVDTEYVLDKWQNNAHLFPEWYPADMTWEKESKQVLTSINNLLETS